MRLIGMRHIGEGFRIIRRCCNRGHVGIGDDIVANVAAKRAGIAQIVHLNRGGVEHHHVRSRTCRIAFEIDQYIDARGVNGLRGLDIAQSRDVVKRVKGVLEALPHLR